jgi:hypothetical protein
MNLLPEANHISTFQKTFRLPKKKNSSGKALSRQHKNPIILAKEWQSMIDKGECKSRADLARYFGITKARITQIMNLLKLSPQVLKNIEMLGDPLIDSQITERKISCV